MSKLLLPLFFLLALYSCSSHDENTPQQAASENDMDAARNFIQAALEGRWSDAKRYMVQDSLNVQLLETSESQYQNRPREDKRGYREAVIHFYESRQPNDSITIVNYSNSYKNKKDSLKVVRTRGQWLIDLKYSLLATDTARHAR